ncbi:MAG: TatD family hydrolase, partial [Plesiomonas shigelloides]
MFDIGVNLTSSQFASDREAVLTRSWQAGLQGLLVTGTSLAESEQALAMTALAPERVWCTAGVHPHDAKTWNAQSAQRLRALYLHDAVVAVGECGLDFNRDFSPRPQQLAAFAAQLALAAEVQLPL